MANTLCFVLMPFGTKSDANGRTIDFDAVYQRIISPAIQAAGLEPIRADEEKTGGIIHKPMFERLILCAYAVADLTNANPNVLYELGIRHAVRPWRTVSLFAAGTRLPFDVNFLRSLPYKLDAQGAPEDAATDSAALADRLSEARKEAQSPTDDSPIYQLVDYLPRFQIPHEKTDLFREQVRYAAEAKSRLASARKAKSAEQIAAVAPKNRLAEVDTAVVIDAMLSYRDVGAWTEMVAFIEAMPRVLRATVMVQEQLGFALNRAQRSDDAEEVLSELEKQHGPSPETLGILGRVYKDRWQAALKAGDVEEAQGHLDKAIATYIRGFEADFRDAYPGVNALTLLEARDPSDPRLAELLPIVRYATLRKMGARGANYWDHATLIELAILGRHEKEARTALGNALAAVRREALWEPASTVANLQALRKQREARGEKLPWAEDVEAKLRAKAETKPSDRRDV